MCKFVIKKFRDIELTIKGQEIEALGNKKKKKRSKKGKEDEKEENEEKCEVKKDEKK